MSAGIIRIPVVPDADAFGGMLKKSLGGALAIAGIGAGFGEVIKLGNDFTNTLNTLQAVSSATADQMAAVRDRAKELGNDLTIPNTSASNAAEAMTELAKGGFSVEQSMAAAKGTLQLAAAAQIDAATAAGIQSKALQTFGLDAEYAGKAADILANAANASNLEMTDVALGLQAGGTVANQFGLTLEDTSAALALFANVGIRGSDAGTLLKSSLLALTDQGVPAQEAISELGLSVYDAQGKFVGLESLMQQLSDASGRMSDEQYQAATATLFGSDAIRFAGIAADDGVPKYQALHDAVEKQGTAAEVAAAKTQGLPGAIQQVQNAAENAALELYELIDGPLEKLATSAASGITSATTGIGDALKNVGTEGLAASPMVAGFVDGIANLSDTGGRVVDFLKPLAVGIVDLVEGLGNSGGIIQTAGSAFDGLVTVFEGALTVLGPVADALGSVASFVGDLPGPLQVGVAALIGLRVAVPPLIASLSGLGTRLTTLGTQAAIARSGFTNMVAAMGLMRTTGTLAAAGMGTLVSALGGPLVLGLTAATVGITAMVEASARSKASSEQYAASARDIAGAQRDMTKAFVDTKGVFTGAAKDNLATQIAGVREQFKATAADVPGTMEKVSAGASALGSALSLNFGAAKDAIGTFTDDTGENAGKVVDAFDDLNLRSDQIAETLVASSDVWGKFKQNLIDSGEGGQEAADKLQGLRDKALQAQTAAELLDPAMVDLGAAVGVLADNASSADDKLNALHTIMNILTGATVPAAEAAASYNKAVNDIVESTTAAIDPAGGLGNALVGLNGAVNTVLPNGNALFEQLVKLRNESEQNAFAAYNAETGSVAEKQEAARESLSRTEEALAALGSQYQLDTDQIHAMAAAMGLQPETLVTAISLQGADEATQDLLVIRAELDKVGAGVGIEVEAPTDVARAELERLGFKVEEINGKPGFVKVTAPTDEAIAELRKLTETPLPDKTQRVNVVYQDSGGPRTAVVGGDTLLLDPNAGLAAGGPITGGVAGTDSVPILAMPGEHMLTVDDVNALGGQQGVYNFRSALQNGVIGKFATGGAVDDDATTRAMRYLRGESGKPYQYGGTGTPSWDCSGFISAAYALVKALEPTQRWFTTESNFNALGFQRGLDPSGRGLSIGVHNGGGGQYSHMAGTLAGTNIESGGNGVQVGSGATGASDGQFENKYYLPAGSFVPPGSGGRGSRRGRSSTRDVWDEQDELKLDSARISVQQAQEAAEKALADPKKSEADKAQAQNRVSQAEQKVRELEAEKASGGDSGPAPSAPALDGSMTDDELRLADLQDALDEANYSRDEVYADPEASEAERAAADRDVYKAMNALAEGQKKQSETGSGTGDGDVQSFQDVLNNIPDAFGDVAKSFVSGQLSDAFGVVGLTTKGAIPTAIGAGIDYGLNLQKQKQKDQPTPGSFSDEEIAKQGPVTPGTPNWLEELAKTFKVPLVLRDQGGPLKHGMAALNLSGETEWVSTAAQRAQELAMMQNVQNGGGVDPGLRTALLSIANRPPDLRPIQVTTGADPQAVVRSLQMEARTRSRSFNPGRR